MNRADSKSKGRAPEVAAIAFAVLVFVYAYPRALLRWLGQDSPWTPYFHLYGLGLVVFLIGLRIILASRACQPGRGRDTTWLAVLLGGFAFFALLHAVWIWAALAVPFKGN